MEDACDAWRLVVVVDSAPRVASGCMFACCEQRQLRCALTAANDGQSSADINTAPTKRKHPHRKPRANPHMQCQTGNRINNAPPCLHRSSSGREKVGWCYYRLPSCCWRRNCSICCCRRSWSAVRGSEGTGGEGAAERGTTGGTPCRTDPAVEGGRKGTTGRPERGGNSGDARCVGARGTTGTAVGGADWRMLRAEIGGLVDVDGGDEEAETIAELGSESGWTGGDRAVGWRGGRNDTD